MQRNRLKPPFLKKLSLLPEKVTHRNYPFNLPILQNRQFALAFETPITFFIGENGTGKSTILEAIAQHCGFNRGGGSRDHAYETAAQPIELAGALRLSWLPKVTNGFFLRAESFFNFATYIDEMRLEWRGDIEASYGPRGMHGQSHGESFLALFRHRLGADWRSIYLLDEPEAALSPARQLEFLRLLHAWDRSGKAQLIIATHSPIIMSYPDAMILSFDGGTVHEVSFRDTDHYRITHAFLLDPDAHFNSLFAADGAAATSDPGSGDALEE